MPVNYNDALTLIHDIDYLRFAGFPNLINAADDTAIVNSQWNASGLAIKYGLTLKRLFDLTSFSSNKTNLTNRQLRIVGQHLMDKIREEPYRSRFKELGVKIR